MVPALGVQGAVHDQVGVVGFQRFLLLFRFVGNDRRAQHQVGGNRLLRVVEGQHVGGVVFLPVVAVERLAFLGVHDANGDLSVHLQRVADPAGDFVALEGVAVLGGIFNLAELQGEAEFWEHGVEGLKFQLRRGVRVLGRPARGSSGSGSGRASSAEMVGKSSKRAAS